MGFAAATASGGEFAFSSPTIWVARYSLRYTQRLEYIIYLAAESVNPLVRLFDWII